jgi:hypothetical protein
MSASTAVVTSPSVIEQLACTQREKAVTGWQLDMFGTADPLVGIEVQLPHHCECGHDLLHIGPGRGAHRASLRCARCGRHCGWLSSESANFLTAVVAHFGRPTAPVRVRVPSGARRR